MPWTATTVCECWNAGVQASRSPRVSEVPERVEGPCASPNSPTSFWTLADVVPKASTNMDGPISRFLSFPIQCLPTSHLDEAKRARCKGQAPAKCTRLCTTCLTRVQPILSDPDLILTQDRDSNSPRSSLSSSPKRTAGTRERREIKGNQDELGDLALALGQAHAWLIFVVIFLTPLAGLKPPSPPMLGATKGRGTVNHRLRVSSGTLLLVPLRADKSRTSIHAEN